MMFTTKKKKKIYVSSFLVTTSICCSLSTSDGKIRKMPIMKHFSLGTCQLMCNAPLPRTTQIQQQASTQERKSFTLQFATSASLITQNLNLEIVCSTIDDNISHTNFWTAIMIILCINCIINSSHTVSQSKNGMFYRIAVSVLYIDRMPKHLAIFVIGYICGIILAVVCVYWIDPMVNHIAKITKVYSFLNGILIIICVSNLWCGSPLFYTYTRPDYLDESSQSPDTTPRPPDQDRPEQTITNTEVPQFTNDYGNDNCNGRGYPATNTIITIIMHTIYVLKFKSLIDLGINNNGNSFCIINNNMINYNFNIIVNIIYICYITIIEIMFLFIFCLFCFISYSCIVVDVRVTAESCICNNVNFRLLNVSVCSNNFLSYRFSNYQTYFTLFV